MSTRTLCIAAAVLVALLFIKCSEGKVMKTGKCLFVWNEPCNSQFIKFYLYTRARSKKGEFVKFRQNGQNFLKGSHYDPSKKNVVIVHGYKGTHKHSALQIIKDEYLRLDSMNIWFLDWSVLVKEPCYYSSVFNARYAGKCLASFIKAIGLPRDNLHVIGYSLGGHVPPQAANFLRPYKIPRITGLDPAKPLFVGCGGQKRLSPDDARFVDVYHTNAFLLGNFLPMGHVDFFINGGISQPGCDPLFDPIECSHHRATEYFAESINSNIGFWGWQCNNFFEEILGMCKLTLPFYQIGEHVNQTARGLMYVETNAQKPFAMGKPELFNIF